MPGYKNRFQRPNHLQQVILDQSNARIGTIRIKPSTVLWKPVNAQKFYSVSLDKFAAWITSQAAGAKRVAS
jgi:hypothetical protein